MEAVENKEEVRVTRAQSRRLSVLDTDSRSSTPSLLENIGENVSASPRVLRRTRLNSIETTHFTPTRTTRLSVARASTPDPSTPTISAKKRGGKRETTPIATKVRKQLSTFDETAEYEGNILKGPEVVVRIKPLRLSSSRKETSDILSVELVNNMSTAPDKDKIDQSQEEQKIPADKVDNTQKPIIQTISSKKELEKVDEIIELVDDDKADVVNVDPVLPMAPIGEKSLTLEIEKTDNPFTNNYESAEENNVEAKTCQEQLPNESVDLMVDGSNNSLVLECSVSKKSVSIKDANTDINNVSTISSPQSNVSFEASSKANETRLSINNQFADEKQSQESMKNISDLKKTVAFNNNNIDTMDQMKQIYPKTPARVQLTHTKIVDEEMSRLARTSSTPLAQADKSTQTNENNQNTANSSLEQKVVTRTKLVERLLSEDEADVDESENAGIMTAFKEVEVVDISSNFSSELKINEYSNHSINNQDTNELAEANGHEHNAENVLDSLEHDDRITNTSCSIIHDSINYNTLSKNNESIKSVSKSDNNSGAMPHHISLATESEGETEHQLEESQDSAINNPNGQLEVTQIVLEYSSDSETENEVEPSRKSISDDESVHELSSSDEKEQNQVEEKECTVNTKECISEDEQSLLEKLPSDNLQHLQGLFNPLQKARRQTLYVQSPEDSTNKPQKLKRRSLQANLADFNPSQSFVESLDQTLSQKPKRQRMSKSFSAAADELEVTCSNRANSNQEMDESYEHSRSAVEQEQAAANKSNLNIVADAVEANVIEPAFDLNPSQSIVESLNQTISQKSKRQRMSKSFTAAADELEVESSTEEEQAPEKANVASAAERIEADVPYPPNVLAKEQIDFLKYCDDVFEAANKAKLAVKRQAVAERNVLKFTDPTKNKFSKVIDKKPEKPNIKKDLKRLQATKQAVKHAIKLTAPEPMSLARKLSPATGVESSNTTKKRQKVERKIGIASINEESCNPLIDLVKTSAGLVQVFRTQTPEKKCPIEFVKTSSGIMRVEPCTPQQKYFRVVRSPPKLQFGFTEESLHYSASAAKGIKEKKHPIEFIKTSSGIVRVETCAPARLEHKKKYGKY